VQVTANLAPQLLSRVLIIFECTGGAIRERVLENNAARERCEKNYNNYGSHYISRWCGCCCWCVSALDEKQQRPTKSHARSAASNERVEHGE
jgi:hypothetical protein